MKQYKLSYGLAGFLNSLEIFYMFLWCFLPVSILYSILEKNIFYMIIVYSIFLGLFILIILFDLLIYLITRATTKYVLFFNNYQLRYKDKVIDIYDIESISFIPGEAGGKHRKGEPYCVTICYKKEYYADESEDKAYLTIERFPLMLINNILKCNQNIHFDKPEIKPVLKQNFKYGFVIGIFLMILCYISDISGCK